MLATCRSHPRWISLANHIGTAFLAYPDFVEATSIDIHPVPYRKGGLCGVLVLGVRDGQFAVDDQMRCQAAMGMRTIMGIADRCACMSALRSPPYARTCNYRICAWELEKGLWRGL